LILATTQGGATTRLGPIAFADIFWVPPEPVTPFVDTTFGLRVELGPLGDSSPLLLPPSPNMPTANGFFEVFFDTDVQGGTVRHTMHFEIGQNDSMQPLTFSNVIVGDPLSPAFDITFDLLLTNGEVHTDAPLFTVKTSATFTPELETETLIDIDPDTLNRNGKGNWITAYITLPDGFDVADIDPASIQITSLLGASCDPNYVQFADLSFTPQVGDRDEDGIQDLTVKFDRQLLLMNICLDDVAITVEGDLSTGDHFIGSDQIRVIERGKP